VSVLYILLPLALAIGVVAVAVFVWAARDGQFDDLDTPPRRMLLDDEPAAQHAPKANTDSGSRTRTPPLGCSDKLPPPNA